MNVYSIAGITVGYDAKYDMLKTRSVPYLCDEAQCAQVIIKPDYDKLEKSLPEYPLLDIQSLEYMYAGSYYINKLHLQVMGISHINLFLILFLKNKNLALELKVRGYVFRLICLV